jgi:hypothetical protein
VGPVSFDVVVDGTVPTGTKHGSVFIKHFELVRFYTMNTSQNLSNYCLSTMIVKCQWPFNPLISLIYSQGLVCQALLHLFALLQLLLWLLLKRIFLR